MVPIEEYFINESSFDLSIELSDSSNRNFENLRDLKKTRKKAATFVSIIIKINARTYSFSSIKKNARIMRTILNTWKNNSFIARKFTRLNIKNRSSKKPSIATTKT